MMTITKRNHSKSQAQIRGLLAVLREGGPVDALEAAKLLIALNAKHSVPQLCRILKTAHKPNNRAAAAYALGFLSGKEAINCLLDVLAGRDSVNVRSHAAEALGHAGDKIALNGLIEALKDRAATVRYWAAFALGEIGSRSALLPLEKLAREDRGITRDGQKVSREARRTIARLKKSL